MRLKLLKMILLASAILPPGVSRADIIPADRTAVWNPGITADTHQNLALGDDRLPVRTTVYKTLSPATTSTRR